MPPKPRSVLFLQILGSLVVLLLLIYFARFTVFLLRAPTLSVVPTALWLESVIRLMVLAMTAYVVVAAQFGRPGARWLGLTVIVLLLGWRASAVVAGPDLSSPFRFEYTSGTNVGPITEKVVDVLQLIAIAYWAYVYAFGRKAKEFFVAKSAP